MYIAPTALLMFPPKQYLFHLARNPSEGSPCLCTGMVSLTAPSTGPCRFAEGHRHRRLLKGVTFEQAPRVDRPPASLIREL
jgi:hypothetical protein